MRTPALMILAIAIVLADGIRAETQSPQGTIRLLNNDSLPGILHTFDGKKITWNSPTLEQPATFLAEAIRDIRMPTAIRKLVPGTDHEAMITLTNGNILRGQVSSMTAEEITLDTWYAGRLVIRRAMVRKLAIRDMPDYVFRGPGVIEDWTRVGDEAAWNIGDDNALVSTAPGGIARDIPLPDEFTLEFEAQWRGSLRLHVILFSDDPTSASPENGYEIVFQRQSVHLRRSGERQWIGHTNRAIDLQRKEKAHIRIQASTRTGQFAFYVNDRLIEAWTDLEIDAKNLGSALQFISRDVSPLVISRIDVSKWNGILGEIPRADEVSVWEDGEEHDEPILLRNGERIHGGVKSIEDGVVHLDTQSLPIGKIQKIEFSPADVEEPKRHFGDIRAWFADGGSIVFRLDGIIDDGKILRGTSQTFGTASFDLSAFSRIEFNIYDLFRESP